MDNCDSTIEVNGDFVVCSKYEEQQSITKCDGVLLYNKIEEGFQKINHFKIEQIVKKNLTDFPFAVGDIVIVCSTGTIVNWKGNKKWLFQPEHILAKIEI